VHPVQKNKRRMSIQTSIIYDQFSNANAIVMENDVLRTVILPEFGGKIASLFHKDRQFELLFQNPKPLFKVAPFGASFAEYEACGFDDAFPTVNEEMVKIDAHSILYPDHGEVWTTNMEVKHTNCWVEMAFESLILPYYFQKRVMLEQDELRVCYKIQNTGDFDFPYVFLVHCLVNTREGMELILPQNTGAKGWQTNGNLMSKWYLAGSVSEGKCGYYFPNEKMRALFAYPPERLPYLGYWITRGGFRGDHNCALEPASAYFDAVSIAREHHRESILHAGETVSFVLSIQLCVTDL